MSIESDISTFVDLASGTLDEDDEAAQKTRYLINALTGYSPLIYDFDPEEKVSFDEFMGHCKEVWRALSENPKLEKNLVSHKIFYRFICLCDWTFMEMTCHHSVVLVSS
mgnify:CR=1 FL=1